MVKRSAVLYMLFSTLCFAAMNCLIREVDHFPPFQLVFFRSIGSLGLCLYVIRKNKISLKGNQPKWLALRGIVGVISMTLFYWALQMMPIGTAVSLRYLSPFFAAVLAVFLLGEKMKNIQWLLLLVAFSGVALIKGFDARISTLGLVIILTAAFFSGLVYYVIRKLGTSEHSVVIVTYFMIISCLVGAVGSLFNWQTPVGIEWTILLCIGLIGYYAQILMTKAIQIEEANRIVPFKYAEVVFTLIAGWLFFSEGQSLITLGGIALIVLALIANAMIPKTKTQ